MSWRIAVLGIASWLACASGVSAQAAPPPLADSLMGQAKLDYEAGRILVDDQDYAGASVKFQQAFEHSRDVRLLWNVAVCEKNLRHYARVLRLLERYQREGGAAMSDAQRTAVREVLETVRTLISVVQLTVDQAGAQVSVDDAPVGTTPLRDPILVDLGTRHIRVSKAGFRDRTIVQNFSGGSQITFIVHLAEEPNEGRLSVFADDATTISVDGRPVGNGHWDGKLPAGGHVLRVSAKGMSAQQMDLLVRPGELRTLHVALRPEPSGVPGWVWIGVGVVAAGGIATGAYFLFRGPGASHSHEVQGTLSPGTLQLP